MSTTCLSYLASLCQGEVYGSVLPVNGLASLVGAQPGDLAGFYSDKQLVALGTSQASALVTKPSLLGLCKKPAIVVTNPRKALANLTQYLRPATFTGVDEAVAAVVNPRAVLHSSVTVGAGSVISEAVLIGEDTIVAPGAVLLPGVKIGAGVYIGPGAVIGAKPFNPTKSNGLWLDGPALGSVLVADEVSIGANTTISRGGFGDTIIGTGVKIDNLVQVAHDVIIGAHTVVAGCVAIGANCIIGEHCSIGGGASIAGQLQIADDVVITGMATVVRSIKYPEVYSSAVTVQKHQVWRKNMAHLHRLSKLVDRLKSLEKNNKKGRAP